MVGSLRALLHGVIDYAGLFPPAALPLEPAVRNFARYRREADAWMLSRFICPAAWLAELAPFVKTLFDADSPLPCSVLGQGADGDLPALVAFQLRHGGRVAADAFETRLSATAMTLADLDLASYFEPTLGDDWRPAIADAVRNIRAFGQRLAVSGKHRGFKLRCGGLQASAFPSVEQIACAIAACRDARVPMKFTAGLHHPIRHFNPGVETHMHGFINVFGAGVLAHARGLDEAHLQSILADEDASRFVFTGSDFRWNDYRATVDEIAAARRDFVVSFGSCSFDEPRDDLRALGWMP